MRYNVTPGEITSKVSEVIKHYWNLAGFETVSSSKNRITKLCKDLNKLFDIAHPQL